MLKVPKAKNLTYYGYLFCMAYTHIHTHKKSQNTIIIKTGY
jgi:hypothetical protein